MFDDLYFFLLPQHPVPGVSFGQLPQYVYREFRFSPLEEVLLLSTTLLTGEERKGLVAIRWYTP
jgi:hypothetical protein